jgi:hypothetical protein
VGGGRRMDGGERASQMLAALREELERVDEFAPRVLAALDLESD